MDKPKVILFYDLCRLCLENPGADDIVTNTDLIQDIFLCTGVKVSTQDNLPQKICTKCLEIVVNSKQLRVLATANDTHLKSLFDDGDTFVISFNGKDKNKENTLSRKSSTDSDRTVKLEIIDNIDQNLNEHCESNKRTICSVDQTDTNKKKISVRKDLFDSSGSTNASAKDVRPIATELKLKVRIKRTKTESGNYSANYLCELCQKTFETWKKYYLHQKTHNRNIICPLDACGKKFATKGDLEKHVRTHTGERPFRCDICDKRFAQRGTLKCHEYTVHGKLSL